MDTDDNTLRERIRPKSTILDDISRQAGRRIAPQADLHEALETPVVERATPLPLPGSPYDVAHSRPENKPVPMLRFIYGDTIRGLPYANLDSIDLVPADKPGGGPVIVIRYNGILPREARINGRHIVMLYDLLSDFRVGWIRELPKGRDFKDDNATVITGITITIIKELKD